MAQTMTPAQFLAAYGSPASDSSSVTAAPSMTTDQFLDAYGTQAPSTAPPTLAQSQIAALGNDKLRIGLHTGVNEASSKIQEALAKVGELTGLTGALKSTGVANLLSKAGITVPTYDEQVAQDSAYNQAGNAAIKNSLLGHVGQIAGQTLVAAPLLSAGAGLVGGGANMLAGAASDYPAASAAIRGAGNFLTGSAGASTPGAAGLLSRTASKAVAGAGAGAGAAELTNGNVKQGAIAGGVLGGVAIPAVGSIASYGKRVLSNILAPITDLNPSALSAKGAQAVLTALQKDGMTATQAKAALTKLGPNATLADVGGANVRSMGEQIAMNPGAGSQLAQDTLEGRAAGAQSRINDAIKNATGVTGNIHADADALIAQRAHAAAPLYDIALAQDKNPVFTSKLAVDPRLAQFANDPIVQQGMQRGAEVARLNALAKGDNFDPQKYLWNTAPEVPPKLDAGTIDPSTGAKMSPDTYTPGTPPKTTVSMNALDAAKRGLDDVLEQYRDPVTGRLNLDQRGKAINDVRAAFIKHLDSINPDYAAARAAYAGPSQSLDAMNMGKRALSNDPEVTSKIVSNLSPGDKQFYLNGVTRALQDKIESTQDGADATRKIFGNTLIRNKIAAAFDDPAKFSQFQQNMEAEAKFAQTRNDLLKGSQTGRRMAGNDTSADFMPHVMQAMTGDIRSGGLGALKSAQNYLMQPSEQRLGAQANYLLGPGQSSLNQAVQNATPGVAKRLLLKAAQTGRNALIPAGAMGYQQAKGN